MEIFSPVLHRPPLADTPWRVRVVRLIPLGGALVLTAALLAFQISLGAARVSPLLLAAGLAVVWLLALCGHLGALARMRGRTAKQALSRLDTEIAERARAAEALRREEERYRLLFERNPGGVYRSTVDGRLLDCNEAFARMYGYPSREAILAQPSADLYVDPADRTALIARLFEEGSLLHVEVLFRKSGGEPFWGLMCESLLRDEEGSLSILEGTIVDITALKQAVTEREQADEALRESESSILSLYNIASAQNLTSEGRIQALLELGCQRFDLEIGILARVQGERYEVVAVRSPDNSIVRGVVLELSDTRDRETLEDRTTVSFERARSSPRSTHPAFAAWGMESYLGAPVRVAGRVFGTLSFGAPDPRATPFKPADLEFLKLMTLWLGGELEREQRNREIVLLSELGGLLQTCDSIEEAYQVISRQGRKLFPDLSGALYRLSASRSDLELVSSWGEPGPWPESDFFRPEDCWGLRLGREHCVEDPAADLICRHVGEQDPPRYLCVPMMAQGEALGVLHLRIDPSRAAAGAVSPLNEARRRLATAVAEHTAMALANLSLRETLRHQSIRDPLTGLFNRRYFEESLEREVRRARRRSMPLGVIMLDLDRFKVVNDNFGHEAGDVLLRGLGELLRRNVRGEDVACRWGGEEFALLLPEATLEVARGRAEELRAIVKDLKVHYQDRVLGPLTISLGVAVFPDQGLSGQSVLRAADAALYQSKAAGRDRVTSALQIAG
ncbi:MAG TPA: diguanylate cyclase [Thermoanaerobaculia bacterium]|nr:diguanylate cyclase [Thermoanaerobaculia bacterium]